MEERNMRNSWYKKGLVLGIIVLFIGLSVLSSVSSKDIITYNEEIEYEIESYDSFERSVNQISNDNTGIQFYYFIFAYVYGEILYWEYTEEGWICVFPKDVTIIGILYNPDLDRWQFMRLNVDTEWVFAVDKFYGYLDDSSIKGVCIRGGVGTFP
jgi:hypothetical protein